MASVEDFLARQREATKKAEVAAKEHEFNIERYEDGSRYEGQFDYVLPPMHAPWLAVSSVLVTTARHGRIPHGTGELYDSSNQLIYSGQWSKGEMTGSGILHSRKLTWKGYFIKGAPHGLVTVTPVASNNESNNKSDSRSTYTSVSSKMSMAFLGTGKHKSIIAPQTSEKPEANNEEDESKAISINTTKPQDGFFYYGRWVCWEQDLVPGVALRIRMQKGMPKYGATVLGQPIPGKTKPSRFYVLFHDSSMRHPTREDQGRWIDLSVTEFDLVNYSSKDVSWSVQPMSMSFPIIEPE